MTFIRCLEYWFDSVLRKYSKRKLAINALEISDFFNYYNTEMKMSVLRVCMKNGGYHDIDTDFDSFCEQIQKWLEVTE